jgi:hypothetical protein
MRYRWRNTKALKKLIDRDTDLVIEGDPRCANSFALAAFKSANSGLSKPLKIATHVHSPVQVKQGVRWSIPCMLLIRNPDDAVVSLLAYAVQLRKVDMSVFSEKQRMSFVHYWTRRYADFYQQLMPTIPTVLLAEFNDVTHDFTAVMNAFNKKFDLSYTLYEHSRENEQHIFDNSRVHLSPSEERDEIKLGFRATYLSEQNKQFRERAQQVYHSVLGMCEAR